MYTIGHVIYGLDATENTPFRKILDEYFCFKDEDLEESPEEILVEMYGFEMLYHGAAENIPLFFGIELGRFTECENLSLNKLIDMADVSKDKQYFELFDSLPLGLREKIIEAQLEPEVLIIWGTS